MSPSRRAAVLAALALAAGCAGEVPEGGDEMDASLDASLVSQPLDAAADSAADAERARWSGITYPPMPDHVVKLAGAVAMAPGQDAADSRWAFAHVRVEVGRTPIDLLWLSRLVSRGRDGKPTWKVVDVRPLSGPAEGERMLISACESGGLTAVAAIMADAPEEVLTEARAAWGIDQDEGVLVPLGDADVRCRRPGLP